MARAEVHVGHVHQAQHRSVISLPLSVASVDAL